MKFSGSLFRNLAFAMIILALTALGTTTSAQTRMQIPPPQAVPQATPAQGQMPPQAPSICGNQPFCYETADFAAVVTDFRTSKSGYFGLIATTLRFVNKTNNSLILGYANGSGTAQDDSGLRYGVGGANGVRGMGLVNGPYADPKFVLQPGGFGDARFELAARLTRVYGVTFELNLTVNEINALEGNQYTVGGEFPLQFQGLTNGARGTAPGAVIPSANGTTAAGVSGMLAGAGSAAPACGPAGTVNAIAGATNSAAAQNAANTATSTVSSTASAISSITSIFGRKKKQADAAAPANTAASVPCVPAAPVAAAAPAVNAATPQAGSSVPVAGAAPAAAPNTPAGTAKPAVVNAPKSPAQPAKPPAKKPAPSTPPAQKTAQPQ